MLPRFVVVCAALLGGMLLPAQGRQPSPELLLEEAIFTEETQGDLPAAMAQYGLLIQQKQSPSVAAQSLCRLAVCHWKQGHAAEAQRLLRQVVAEHPEEKELVRLANAFLHQQRRLLPPVWRDGEIMEYTLEFPTGVDAGFLAVMAHRTQYEGRQVWRLASIQNAPSYGGSSRRFVHVDAVSFRPLYNEYDHPVLGSFHAFFDPQHIRIVSTNVGTSAEKKIPLEGSVFDYEQYWHALRQLPLAIGYRTSIPVANCSQAEIVDLEVRVVGLEEIVAPAGTFTCFRVETVASRNGMQTTLWFTTDAERTLVAFDEWFIRGKLRRVLHRGLDEPASLENQHFGVRWTAPPGWYLHERKTPSRAEELTIFAIPPTGRDQIVIRVRETGSEVATDDPPAMEKMLAQLVTRQFEDDQARRKGLHERRGSREILQREGLGRVSYRADFVDAGIPMAQYVICLRDAEREMVLSAQGPPVNEPEFSAVLDELAASYEPLR